MLAQMNGHRRARIEAGVNPRFLCQSAELNRAQRLRYQDIDPKGASSHASQYIVCSSRPLALLLPLTAHADWPKGEREKYMAQCTEAATPQIGPAAAKAHCACGADAIKSYPAADIQALMDNKATPQLQQKALGEIAKCKADNKAKK